MVKHILVLTGLLVVMAGRGWAQSGAAMHAYKFEKTRLLWHDKIDKQQQLLQKLDGKDDGAITLSMNETVNQQIEYAMITEVDQLQEKIERDSSLSHSSKVKYLLGLESLIKGYNANYQRRDFPPPSRRP